jgi:hypothetical protein
MGDRPVMKKSAKTLGILLVLAVLGYGLYVRVLEWHENAVRDSLEQESETWQRETARLEREIAELKDELLLKQEAALPEGKLKEVFGEDVPSEPGPVDASDREGLERRVREFFAYLDEKDYVRAYGVDKGTIEAFQGMADRLAASPPAVSAELKDPFLLVSNVAHFFRVLGKRDLCLARDVIENESEVAEPVAAALFAWILPEGTGTEPRKRQPSLGTLYEYAGFFLNSVGGRSYLLRRDSRVRILTTYYCVLILDRANREEINSHGIDIRPHLVSVAEEIRSHRGLVYQKDYLARLAALLEKYDTSKRGDEAGELLIEHAG